MPVLGSSGGGSSSNIPVFTAAPTVTAADAAMSRIAGAIGTDLTTLPGFSENGDYVKWQHSPTSGTNYIQYYDNTDTLQWTVNETDVDAGAVYIAAICKVGSLIYGVAKDNGTTNGFVFTVNSSGTVNNLATITLKSTNNAIYEPRDCWLGKIYGETNLYFTDSTTAGGYEINITTGALVTSASSTGSPSFALLSFLTSAKVGFGFLYNQLYVRGTPTGAVGQSTLRPFSWGNSMPAEFSQKFPNNNYSNTVMNIYKCIYWDGTIYTAGWDSGAQTAGPLAGYAHKDVDDYFVSILDEFGLNAPATWS